MTYSIALVGAGPTAIYSLQALLTRPVVPASITVFERQRRAGQGTPYSATWSDPFLLANIASVEIPPLPQSLVEWLKDEPDARLIGYGIDREEIDDRAFYPRLVLGEYLAAQFSSLVVRGRSAGVKIEVRTQADVKDAVIVGETIQLTVNESRLPTAIIAFDYVVLATGHQWPSDPELRPGYFTSPWPASALVRIHNCPVGIRGASLTAIDATVVLAIHHGEFVHSDVGELRYEPKPNSNNFSITMFSRKGVLPEADFFHPIPYEPLAICNCETMQRTIETSGADDRLDGAFELFRREIMLVDARYADSINIQGLTLEQFCAAYFNRRTQMDPFDWARRNLQEAIANFASEFTVAWRYAILRMHEVFEIIVPDLCDVDFERFSQTLKPVFVDNYATVPHESVSRLLALHASQKLAIEKLEGGLRIDTRSPNQGAVVSRGKAQRHFPAFIEATGQRVLSAKDFPFPSLRSQGVVQDVQTSGKVKPGRGIAVDSEFHPISSYESSDRLFCLSIPFLLGQHPFAQGITSSAAMADVVSDAIQTTESRAATRTKRA